MIDVVIIPARGGSKRIKNKNLTPFLGEPMLSIAIKLAQKVSSNVIVSSDSQNILDFALKFGVTIIERGEELSNDLIPTLPVIKHALMELKKIIDIKQHSAVLCLYPTAMFSTSEDILSAFKMLESNKYDYIATVTKTSVFRSFELRNNCIKFLFENYKNERTQDLPPIFRDAGQFYLGFAKSFLEEREILGGNTYGLILENAVDIDTSFDLKLAECIKKNEN